MATYTVTSEEGATYAGSVVGAEVELDLDEDTERAVVAAGWLEPKKGKK